MQHFADRLVGGDTAGANHRCGIADPGPKQAQPGAQPILDDIDHRLLKRGAEIGDIAVAQRRNFFRFKPQRGLEPGE